MKLKRPSYRRKRPPSLMEQLFEQFPLMPLFDIMALLTLAKIMGVVIIETEDKVVVIVGGRVKVVERFVPPSIGELRPTGMRTFGDNVWGHSPTRRIPVVPILLVAWNPKNHPRIRQLRSDRRICLRICRS